MHEPVRPWFHPPDMRSAPSWQGRKLDENDSSRPEPRDGLMDAEVQHLAEEVIPPADHLGLSVVLLWLVVGSALVATAIVAFGWRRTLEIWAVSGVLLPLLFVGERLWYRFVRKSA